MFTIISNLAHAGGIVLLIAAGVRDFISRTVPNRVPALIAILALALQWQAGSLRFALPAGAAVFIVAAFCWRRGWLGGGDVKLFAAAALLVPPGKVPAMIVAVALAGGALALLYLALAALLPNARPGRPAGRLARILRIERRRIRRHGPLPYASAIAAGAIFILLRP